MKFKLSDRLIILSPLLIPLAVSVGSLAGVISHGPAFSRTFTVTLSIILSTYIGVALWQMSSIERSQPQPEAPILAAEVKRAKRQGALLFIMSLLGGFFSLLILGLSSLRNIVGTICFISGLLVLLLAFNQSQLLKGRFDQKTIPMSSFDTQSLERMYSSHLVWRTGVLTGQALAGIFFVMLYLVWDASQYLSIWDVTGVLFAVISFMVWYVMFGQYLHSLIEASSRPAM